MGKSDEARKEKKKETLVCKQEETDSMFQKDSKEKGKLLQDLPQCFFHSETRILSFAQFTIEWRSKHGELR